MKTFLACILAVCVSASAFGQTTSWLTVGKTVSVQLPASTTVRTAIHVISGGDPNTNGTLLQTFYGSQFTTSSAGSTQNATHNSQTRAAAFHVKIGYQNMTSNAFVWQYWQAAYPSATPAAWREGGFNPNGEPIGATGQPVDADGNEVPSGNNVAKVAVTNSDTWAKRYRITTRDVNGNIINQREVTVAPNSTTNFTLGEDQPFTYSIEATADGADGGPATWTPTASGNSFGSNTTQGQGLGTNTTPTSLSQPAATTNQTRPGASPDPNAEARHTELRDELKRIVTSQTNIGTTAHGDSIALKGSVDQVQKVLRDFAAQAHSDFLESSTLAQAAKVEANTNAQEIKSAIEEGGGGAGGGLSQTQTKNAVRDGVLEANQTAQAGTPDTSTAEAETTNALEAGQDLAQEWVALKTATSQLVGVLSGASQNLGLNANIGTMSWNKNLDLGPIGVYTLDFDSFMATWSPMIRDFNLWSMGVLFLGRYFKLIRGAFVG